MTQVWDKAGTRLPITVVFATPHRVTQVKTLETDGYTAAQFGFGVQKATRLTKPLQGHLKKSGSPAIRTLKEIATDADTQLEIGAVITPKEVLQAGDIVQVTGKSRGRGFAGAIKRWGFKGGPKTHGQSDRHRAPGSIGQGTDPGRVWPGKKMAGHYGDANYTIKNLTVVKVTDTGEIWIKGAVPGTTGALVKITKTGTSTKFTGLREEIAAPTEDTSVETAPTEPTTEESKTEEVAQTVETTPQV